MANVNGGQITLTASQSITTAVTGSTLTAISAADYDYLSAVTSVSLGTIFTYGSGGTTAKVWLQTSLDGGTTWIDVISHAYLLATASKVSTITANIAPASQAFAPTDGSLTDNTIIQGVLGDRWRIKWTTTGTYAGGTTFKAYMVARF